MDFMQSYINCNMQAKIAKFIEKSWQKKGLISNLLYPFSLSFFVLITLRKFFYKTGVFKSYKANAKVIIVGNITVGGTGKTPFTLALFDYLSDQGYKVLIINKGYQGKLTKQSSVIVQKSHSAKDVGDESLLYFENGKRNIISGKSRAQSIKLGFKKFKKINIILSDDGLQDYSLKRDIEIALVDKRFANNTRLLPAGGFRETQSRLKKVDYIISTAKNQPQNLFFMQIKALNFVNTKTKKISKSLPKKNIIAISAIGNPNRFYQSLAQKNLKIIKKIELLDHQKINTSLLKKYKNHIVVITKKDYVKLDYFSSNVFYLDIKANLEAQFLTRLTKKLNLY